jgi:hypothetical protein
MHNRPAEERRRRGGVIKNNKKVRPTFQRATRGHGMLRTYDDDRIV